MNKFCDLFKSVAGSFFPGGVCLDLQAAEEREEDAEDFPVFDVLSKLLLWLRLWLLLLEGIAGYATEESEEVEIEGLCTVGEIGRG